MITVTEKKFPTDTVKMGSEKFCLRWNDFETNISNAFRELRHDQDFFDITIACEDDQVKAHKVILSACSPLLRDLLRRNPHQHPLLYFRGVRQTEMKNVLNFMYHGEVNVAQEELNQFLTVAEDLKVKGLTQNSSEKVEDQKQFSKPVHQSAVNPNFHVKSNSKSRTSYTVEEDIQEIVPVKSEPVTDSNTPSSSMTFNNEEAYASGGQVAITGQEEQYEDYGMYETDQDYFNDSAADPMQTGKCWYIRYYRGNSIWRRGF